MSITTKQPHLEATADLYMLVTLAIGGLVALAAGAHFAQMAVAAITVGVLLATAGGAYALARGRTPAHLAMTVCAVGMVALHIQLGRGTLEFHFGVFVVLAMLLVYQRWPLILLAAGLFAVHHVAFDRLQSAGMGFYCTPQADFFKVLMHAGYVVVQAGFEVVVVLSMNRLARQHAEVEALVSRRDVRGGLSLDVATVPATTQVAGELKTALAKVAAALAEVRSSATGIQNASSKIADSNQDLSHRTEETSSNLQQAAGSMEQLNGTVQQSARAADEAHLLAQRAADVAQRGGTVMAEVVGTMQEIDASSKRIADIIGTIDGIAFQTNILALNAAVEAARAGEQGRGFAVVASEVRSLAQRSAAAAREIKGLIGNSVDKVAAGSRLVTDAGATMHDIVASVQRVTDIIGDKISAVSREQSAGIGRVSKSVSALDMMTQQNAALVDQTAAASQSLKDHASRLAELTAEFGV